MEDPNKNKDQNKEQKENNNTPWKKIDQKQEFLVAFKEESDFEFTKKLLDTSSLNESWIKNKLEEFKKKNEKFKDFDINKITLKDLKEKFTSDLVSLDLARKELLKTIDTDYDLDDKQINLIESEIKKLNFSDLPDFSKNKDKRDEFLKDTLKIDSILEIEKPELYTELLNYFSKEKIEKLSEEKQKEVYKLLNEFKSFESNTQLWNRQIVALQELLQLDSIFDNDFKKKIFKRYLPYLKFSILKKVISNDNYKKLKQDFYNKYYKESDYNKEEILKLLDQNTIKINSEFILDYFDDKNIEKLFRNEDILYKLSESFVNHYNNSIYKWKKRLEDEISSFNNFKDKLKEYWILDAEKFKEGSILKIQVKTKKGFTEQYFRIDSIWEETKKVNFSIVGARNSTDTKVQITNKPTEKDVRSFLDILNILKKWKTDNAIGIDFKLYKSNDFKEIIKDEENFDISYDSLEGLWVEDLESDKALQEKIKNELIELTRKELDDLEKELWVVEEELKLLSNKQWSYKSLSSEELESRKNILNEKKQQLELFIQEKKEDINKLWEDNIDLEKLVAYNNFNDLVKKIGELDSDWKSLGLKKWIEIEYQDKNWNFISFEVVWINKNFDNQTIVLKNVRSAQEEIISYEAFYQAFKNNKANRVEKINLFEELFEKNNDNESWKWFKIESWELIQKDVNFNDENWKRKTDDKKIDYLVWDKWELIKIEDIWNWELEVRFGELETKTDKESDKKEEITNTIKLIQDTEKISYNELQKLIKEKNYVPDWKIWKEFKTKYPEDYQNDLEWSFATRFWNRKSITELIQWWKMLVDGIIESMKKWNDVRAAEFALWISKFLPSEVAEDFEAQVEMNQAEAMDKELTKLWKIDSGKATSRVLGWLKNKDTPEYRKEAWLMYIAKYGILYAKKLAPYKWSFLWYEVLWGKVWDKLYRKVEEEAKREWLPFDEKELIIALLWAQRDWTLKPKRRSKFHKEFKWKISSGFNDENSDWYKDAKDKRTIWQIIWWWMWEIYGWTFPNALAWARRSVEKWWSLEDMNHLYFVSIYSWALYDAPSNVLENQLKTDWQNWNSMLLAWLGSTLWWQKLFNKTVKDLSLKIELVEPKYKGIASDALEIYNNYDNKTIPHNKKIEKTENFWKKYWKVLSRSLYMVDDNNTEFSKTDKLIFFWKDWEFKEYYDTVKDMTSESYVYWKDFMADAVWASWVADTNLFKVLEHHFWIDNSLTFNRKDVVDVIWPKVLSWFNTIPEKVKQNPENKEKYKEYVNTKLRQVVWGLLSWAWKDRVRALDTVNPVWYDLQSFWIKPSDFWWVKIEDILDWTVWKDIFNKATENILNWNTVETSILNTSNVFDEVEKYATKIDESL